MPVIMTQSTHVLLDCEEVSPPGLKRGIGVSKDLIISLLPNLPDSNCEDFHGEVMLAVPFAFLMVSKKYSSWFECISRKFQH
jgi:hypothetical protein